MTDPTPAPAPAPAPVTPDAPAAGHSPFVAVLVTLLALMAWAGAQTWELVTQRGNLKALFASQQQTVDNAAKLRASLDAVAADTQRMANAGNPNAALLVEELRRRGVTITVPAAGAPGAAASAPR